MKPEHYESLDCQLQKYKQLRPLDVALVGATGVGKSSTINFLFGDDVAKVGFGVAPETQENAMYEVSDIFRIHDTAGLGDGLEADKNHSRNISNLLLRTFTQSDGQSYHLIDLVMVILDGSSRDLGTTYQLLEQVVLRCIEPERVIVAINQADMAMKGRGWNTQLNKPDETLALFLHDKSASVQQRIKEATGISIRPPVFYSAYYGYNLEPVMDRIIASIPTERRKVKG